MLTARLFLEEGIRFLRELIFAPLFSEENLEEAKRVLRMKIERMQDDAAQYVIHRGLKEAGKGHPLAVSSLGEIEELEGLTLEDMRQTHQALLSSAADRDPRLRRSAGSAGRPAVPPVFFLCPARGGGRHALCRDGRGTA